jgi:hypothetical protein
MAGQQSYAVVGAVEIDDVYAGSDVPGRVPPAV